MHEYFYLSDSMQTPGMSGMSGMTGMTGMAGLNDGQPPGTVGAGRAGGRRPKDGRRGHSNQRRGRYDLDCDTYQHGFASAYNNQDANGGDVGYANMYGDNNACDDGGFTNAYHERAQPMQRHEDSGDGRDFTNTREPRPTKYVNIRGPPDSYYDVEHFNDMPKPASGMPGNHATDDGVTGMHGPVSIPASADSYEGRPSESSEPSRWRMMLDVLLYIVSGVVLIFIMDQFVKIGIHMGSSLPAYSAGVSPFRG